MRKLLLFIILAFLLAPHVRANDAYLTQFNNVGANELFDNLDEKTQDFFNEYDIDPENYDWVNRLSAKNVFAHVWDVVTSGIKTPFRVGVLIASIIFLSASLTAFGLSPQFEIAIYVAVLSIGALIASNVWQSIESSTSAVKACSAFMLAFVPVFASVLALSGKAVTAPTMSALLLGVSEMVSFISSFVVLPLMGGYLALSIGSSVSPLLKNSGIVESVKKLSIWIMSLLGTLFVGVLGIQTAVNSAADSVTLRTAKFILGTSVPVAGAALSEAVSTISASMGLLRSSIGIYGVVAVAAILIPIVIEIILWRVALMIDLSLAELFSLANVTGILKAVDSMFSVLLGVVLTVGGMFIISLSVIITAGKT